MEAFGAGDLLMRATALAASMHYNQYRKHAINELRLPYISHPIEVMKVVWKWGVVNGDVLSAAVCHDIREDTSITHQELCTCIGQTAAAIVEELTFIPPDNREEKAVKKAEYLASFVAKSIEAFIVKLADRICNVEDHWLSSVDYAIEYGSKARILFETFYVRKQEIQNKYGDEVTFKIQTAIEALGEKIILASNL